MHHNHGPPRGSQFLKENHDGLLSRRINPGERFVHEIELRILGQGPGEEDALLLTAGELADLASGVIGHAYPIERFQSRGTMRFCDAFEPADLPVAPHRHHIEGVDGKFPVHTFPLGHIADKVSLLSIGLAVDEHAPGSLGHEVEHGLDKRALARTVRADDADELAFGGIEVDVPQNRLAVIGHRHVVNTQRRVFRMLLPGGDAMAGQHLLHRICRGLGLHSRVGIQSIRCFHGASPVSVFTVSLPFIPAIGAVPPRARVTIVTLWSIMPR